ncbi:MAG: 3-dehydroquinate synthase [Nocardioides sp.]
MTTLHVDGANPYDVEIGRSLAGELPGVLGDSVQRVALLYAAELATLVNPVLEVLVPSYDVLALGLPSGEGAKTIEVAEQCWEALGEKGFTRSDAVVTFGGGSVTDLGGFVAACWLRGVTVVHMPTTLLAMVDAAVGGKTGVNTSAGKNLVGAFHEPAAVLCDLAMLDTLPTADLLAGMAEAIKCGFIADPDILDLVENMGPVNAEALDLPQIVARAIKVKIDVVVADLKETGGTGTHPGREALNYGHTLAHAIEKHSGFTIRHGDAVAIGCVYAAEIGRLSGLLDDATADRHRRLFEQVGLPTTYPEATFDDLIPAMRLDKKARGSLLRFLVLGGLAQPQILNGPDEDVLRKAFEVVAG